VFDELASFQSSRHKNNVACFGLLLARKTIAKNPSRLVYGVASLLLGTPVEVELVFEVAD
jgi:hypothetical protein